MEFASSRESGKRDETIGKKLDFVPLGCDGSAVDFSSKTLI